MVQLDSRLPLLGIPADIPGSFQRGLEFRERRRQIGENQQISDLFQSQVRIPEYPATRSDDIRPLIPGYPASLGLASLSLFP